VSSIALKGRYITAMGEAHGRKEDLTVASPEGGGIQIQLSLGSSPFRAEKIELMV
jgi:hypothetical protein